MKKSLLLILSSFLLTSCSFVLPWPSTNNSSSEEETTSTTVPTTTENNSSPSDTSILIPEPSTSEDLPFVISISIEGHMSNLVYTDGDEWNLKGLFLRATYSDNSVNDIGDLTQLYSDENYVFTLSESKPIYGLTELTIEIKSLLLDMSCEKTIRNIQVDKREITEEFTNFISPDDYDLSAKYPRNYHEYSNVYPYNFKHTPASGDTNVLVLPVAFKDSKGDTLKVLTDLNKAFNGTGKDTGWESVSSYFKKSSYNTFTPTFEIASEWIQLDYTTKQVGQSNEQTTISIVKEAVEKFKKSYDGDFTKFDKDENGYIDSVFVIYASNNYSVLGDYSQDNLWAYCFSIQDDNPDLNSPNPNMFVWAAYDFMYSDGNGSSLIDIDAHTYIHEFGHSLGLDDYYDYNNGRTSPAGCFDMQDMNVGDHNSFSKFALGWSKPYVVYGNSEITITTSAENKNQSIIIPTGGYEGWNKSPFDEYLLLELYSDSGVANFDANNKTYSGYPTGLTDTGIKLYHVDARLYEHGIRNGALTNRGYENGINSNYYYTVAANNTSGGDYQTTITEAKNFDLLHLISASGSDRFARNNMVNNNDLFKEGDSFSMTNFSSYFPNKGKMNDNSELNISFTIKELTETSATIVFTLN